MCPNCSSLKQALEDSHASEQELQRNIEALQAQLLRTARAEQAARAELTKHREDSPRAVEIRSVLDHYVQKFGKTRSYKVGSETARWKSVDRMLKLGYTADELREAVDGLHALPFVGPKGRQAAGGDRHDDITLCLRDETHVDRFRSYLAKTKRAGAEEAERARQECLWPPVDRVLLELRNVGCEYRHRPLWFGDGDRPAWAFEADCPLCDGTVRVGESHETRFATLECGSGCDWWRLLDVLRLWPSDLSGPSDPGVVWAPLIEVGLASVHRLPGVLFHDDVRSAA